MNIKVNTNQLPIAVITTTAAFLAAMCVWTICWLSYKGIQIPPELNTLTGTLCGYLTGTLTKTTPTEMPKSPSPIDPNAPSQVQVVNPTSDPVPTVETNKILSPEPKPDSVSTRKKKP